MIVRLLAGTFFPSGVPGNIVTVVEEYELEIELERDEGATRSVGARAASKEAAPGDLGVRVRALLNDVAIRVRAAPLVLVFAASVIGFMASSALVNLVVAVFVMPEFFVSSFLAAGAGASSSVGWIIMGPMLLSALIGTAGALLVFWRRATGWACLVAFAVWQLVGPYVLYLRLMAEFDIPAAMVPSFWALQDAGDWTTMAIRLLFLGLLFLPPVLRWVTAKPVDTGSALPSGTGVVSEGMTSERSRPWSVQAVRARVLR